MEKTTIQPTLSKSVEILILADNVSDVLLPGNRFVERPPLAQKGLIPTDTLLAEHGLCLLVTVKANGKSHDILLDTGYSKVAVRHNLNFLGERLDDVEAIVLSHGHMDHTGGLEEILGLTGPGTPLVVHPDAFLKRSLHLPTGDALSFPDFPSREILSGWGANVVENKAPMLIGDDTVLVTGEVERTTTFEKGMPGTTIQRDNGFVPDTFTDDQSLVIDLAEKGLVIISGCAHAGIINSIAYAKRITGRDKIHAVIGGFHLSGAAMAPNVDPTIEALKQIPMEMICPMHCTGFDTIERIVREMPEQFVRSSVGSRIVL